MKRFPWWLALVLLCACKSVPLEVSEREFSTGVQPADASACVKAVNGERGRLSRAQNVTTTFALVVVLLGAIGSLAAAFIATPKTRKQAGAVFASLTVVAGGVPTVLDDPLKCKDDYAARRRLWDEAVSSDGTLSEAASALALASKDKPPPAEAAAQEEKLKAAQGEVRKLTRHVRDVLQKCTVETPPTEIPERPTISDATFELGLSDAVASAETDVAPQLRTLKTELKKNPVEVRRSLRQLVDGNAKLKADRQNAMNAIDGL